MVEYWLPSPALRGYVRQLQLIRFDFSTVPILPFKPYWPRPENCLTLYPRDSETITYPDENKPYTKPRSVLVGQPTILTNGHMGRDFMLYQVVFQPGALFRLTGLPAYELTDTFVDAEVIFSAEIRRLNQRLNSTDKPGEMTTHVESFLHELIRKTKHDLRPIDRVAPLMLTTPVATLLTICSMDWLASEACLSLKQFYRKTIERLGVSPKLFDRIIRFNQAVKRRDFYPAKDWLSIAIESGYHDYQHLVRDVRAFTTLTPTEFAHQEKQVVKCLYDTFESMTESGS